MHPILRPVLCLVLAAAALGASACSSGTAADGSAGGQPTASGSPAVRPTPTYDEHGHPVGLHEWNPFTETIVSGGQPDGDEAFRNLCALGFTTVVSVDGAKPDLEMAKKYGLRYVHVPVQYSGVTPDEVAQIAKAIQTAGGPVYVHCHHGKHRGPAATGATCVGLGLMTPEQAVADMKVSGTDPKYKGLYRDVENAKPIAPERIAAVTELREYVAPDDLAVSMVGVDLRWDHLKASKEAKWGVPPKNPDIDPPHEATMLWEHYREIARLDEVKERGGEFMKHLTEAEASADALALALKAKDSAAADTAFARSGKACSSCHAKYRDN